MKPSATNHNIPFSRKIGVREHFLFSVLLILVVFSVYEYLFLKMTQKALAILKVFPLSSVVANVTIKIHSVSSKVDNRLFLRVCLVQKSALHVMCPRLCSTRDVFTPGEHDKVLRKGRCHLLSHYQILNTSWKNTPSEDVKTRVILRH